MTRSLGDASMKEFVVGSPYTTETTLDDQDEFLIVACDGVGRAFRFRFSAEECLVVGRGRRSGRGRSHSIGQRSSRCEQEASRSRHDQLLDGQSERYGREVLSWEIDLDSDWSGT